MLFKKVTLTLTTDFSDALVHIEKNVNAGMLVGMLG